MARRIPIALGAAALWSLPAALLSAEAEAAGEAAKPVIPPTVWGILIFITVLLILWRKAYPPITGALERRAKLIQESLEAAERAKAESEALLRQHEESLEKARAEARAIIEEGKSEALKVKEGIIEGARKESEEIAARALRDIELAKTNAVDELHRRAVDLSIEIASKVIRKSLRAEDHGDLIRESIRKFQEAK